MIQKIPFGRTGHLSSRIIFGGWALSQATQAEADRVLDLLLEWGINHIDTAAAYGNAEKRIGPWMKEHRDQFFLGASRTGGVAKLNEPDKILKEILEWNLQST